MSFKASTLVVGLWISLHLAYAALDNDLRQVLVQNTKVNVFLAMNRQHPGFRELSSEYLAPDRRDKLSFIRHKLLEFAKESQKPVRSFLAQERSRPKYKSFWLSNEIYIEGASLQLLEELTQLSGVERIYEEPIFPLEPIIPDIAQHEGQLANNKMQWNIKRINAHQVWEAGNFGQGIVVGGIDTGVFLEHEAMVQNYVGNENYGWFDPHDQHSTSPSDHLGHGTHTMGIAVGQKGIGVAPGAKWMACRGCGPKGCQLSSLLSCGEFMLCPHSPDKMTWNCSRAPHVINNSWGRGRNITTFDRIINVWREAGIIPVYAAGNSGKNGCTSILSPGDNANVITVGATTYNNTLAKFSSRGPPLGNRSLLKPDLTAPGAQIRSAWPGNNSVTEYRSLSGTSMACPHITGAIALLLSSTPRSTFSTITIALTTTTAKSILISSSSTCGSLPVSNFPNFLFGNGLLDVWEAQKSLEDS